ncbi:MAG: SMP-30/gluconolactonase/LRE family protein [Candidatus Nealsonbacteria bacterium]|nr:SMP-30/gluconolactonase/LRE family protein [Candidatus Nealsonbacteria bacterium]
MKKFIVFISFLTLLFAFHPVSAEEDLVSTLKARIQALQEQIVKMQEELNKAANELIEIEQSIAFTQNLYSGAQSGEVKNLQQFLSQYPDIYPEGQVTGYFGPLTQNAVKRFQEKYADDILKPSGLTVATGYVGPATRAKLNELAQKAVPAVPAIPAIPAVPTETPAVPAIPAAPATPATPAKPATTTVPTIATTTPPIAATTTPDTAAPANVTNLTATAAESMITLSWVNPLDADFAGIKLMRKDWNQPAGILDGTQIYNGIATSTIERGLVNGISYCYKAFTYDEVPNYSSGAGLCATPTSTAIVTITTSTPATVSTAPPSTSTTPTPTPTATPAPTTATTTATVTVTTTAATTTTTTTTTASAITVTYPNGGETWEYGFNQGIGYTSNGVSRVGFKILKGSQVVYQTSGATTAGLSLSFETNAQNSSSTGSGSDYKVRVFDWDNSSVYDESNSYFSIAPADTTPPVVSNISVSSITADSAVISWTTDESSYGYINYGPGAYTSITPQDNFATSHSFTLSNLTSGALFLYRIYAVDAKGNGPIGYPPEYTFTTLAPVASANTPQFLSKWSMQGEPYGIAIDHSGNVYVTNKGYNFDYAVYKFTSNGTFITKWGPSGTGNGQFGLALYIAVDANSNVYVTDYSRKRIQKFTSDGTFITKWGSSSTADGQFYETDGIAVDSSGNVYVTDTSLNRIQKFTSDGTFITKWNLSSGGNYGGGRGVATDSSGNVYIADRNYNRVQKFTSDGTLITQWGSQGSGDGQFADPYGIAVDISGNIYVTDRSNHRIQKFTSDGAFITKWGSYGTNDGQFYYPDNIAVDVNGNSYVVQGNAYIQKFTPAQTALLDIDRLLASIKLQVASIASALSELLR